MLDIWLLPSNQTYHLGYFSHKSIHYTILLFPGSFLEKFYKLETIIIFIQLVLDVQNVEIHLAMAKKCFFKVLPSGIQDVDQVRTNLWQRL